MIWAVQTLDNPGICVGVASPQIFVLQGAALHFLFYNDIVIFRIVVLLVR